MSQVAATPGKSFADLLAFERCFVFGASVSRLGPIAFLRARGLEVVGLADNNPALHAQERDGLRIHSAREVARALDGRTAVVIASAYQCEIFTQLVEAEGCDPARVFPYVDEMMFAAQDPRHLDAGRDRAESVLARLADDASRAYFASLLDYRAHLDPRRLRANPHIGPQYIYAGLGFPAAGQSILDGGAYDGASAADFLAACRGDCTIHCVEAFPPNVPALEARLAEPIRDGRVRVHACALGAAPGEVQIAAALPGAAPLDTRAFLQGAEAPPAEAGAARFTVPAVTVDQYFANEPLDFIKLDVEGSELDVLLGARETIARRRPALAVSGYHVADHLWRIPELVAEVTDGYDLYAAHHPRTLYEIEFYFAPR